ncbi:acyl-CoA mutase large subunit family protein [Methylotetracoccus oryzae]|uniref:acyl-CoA mutase large subunit family protein n=1 Tax=Methylotetracoccus oryzae TaxID=1919059 RepID=UPI00111BA1BE|nr:methylmalonyl-CoA mutase family protein [Methylotetracoccus oryzae]
MDEKDTEQALTPEEAKRQWENGTVAKTIARCPERQAQFKTGSGLDVDRLYVPDPAALTGESYRNKLGFPGQYPFTRGIQPTLYRGRFWTMRQYAGYATAQESNRRFRYLLEQGSTGLSVAFDLPTQIGYDSDDPLSCGEVGRVGVAVSTVEDMAALFDGIPLDRVSTSMTINATAAVILAMYIVVAERQGAPLTALAGTIQNDILKEYFARGTYRFPPKPSLRLISDLFAYCASTLPKWNAISVSGYHIREAGATAAQEIGFTLADAVCYIETAIAAGLDVDDFAPQITFFFAAHMDLLEEVAKFRAARRLYARLMKERFGAKNPKSLMLRFHTQTSGVALTAQQPDNNVVRVAIQALAAVLGGTQSLHTNSKDEALALPTEDSVRLALRTQQIIAHETGVANTIDPLGGSYYVESLTDRLEAEAEEWLARIDSIGGMVAAVEQGYVQRAIEQAAYEYGNSIETGDRTIVGVNKFVEDKPPAMDLFSVAAAVETRQAEAVTAVKRNRDAAAVAAALSRIEQVARGNENLMPAIIAAVRVSVSLGEICSCLQNVFGEHVDAFS